MHFFALFFPFDVLNSLSEINSERNGWIISKLNQLLKTARNMIFFVANNGPANYKVDLLFKRTMGINMVQLHMPFHKKSHKLVYIIIKDA